MRPSSTAALLTLCLAVTAGCGAVQPGASGGGGGGGSESPCSASKACPSGQFCFNGICAVGCQSNQDCASDQYCATDSDRLCHNKTVTTCPEVPCASGQQCVSGLCSTPPPPTQCDPEQVGNGMDGCEKNAICLDPATTEAKDPKCYSFPACGEGDTCPTGTQGAVCNVGLIPNKGKICLTGLCTQATHCPKDWACFKYPSNAPVGFCSNKGPFAPCTTAADCTSGNCMTAAPGFPGFCQ